MSFRTKLDFSDNRQVKQHIETLTQLSGATSFGVTFSALPTGPDLNTTGITQTINSVISSFSGNSGTTIYSWGDSRMSLGENTLSAITPSNSATTQNGGPTFTANTTTLIDGNQVALTYSGVSYDVSVTGMTDLGGGNYSGDISTNLFRILSADTIDFTGRTIWNDVSGITRTERLIITDNPQVGYVWTCIDSEGMGSWVANSSADTNTYTTGATLINNIAYFDTNASLSAYTLNLTSLSGSPTYWSASTGTNAIVTKNSNHLVTGNRSVALGGQNITGATDDMVYVPSATISTNLGVGTEPEHIFHIQSGLTQVYYDNTSVGGRFLISGSTGLPRFDIQIPQYLTNPNAGGSIGVRTWDDVTWTGYGKIGDMHLYSGEDLNGLNIISSNGTNTEDYIRLFAGQSATGISDIHIQGSGLTRGYVGIGLTDVTQQLDVANNARFRNIGSAASAGALHYTADGTLTTNTSDSRLKTNIQPVTNALDKILNLRGVYYNWIEDITGSTRLGFIAQEVNSVVPELSFTNERSPEKYMGVHYDNVTALLVEGIKELVSGQTTINNTHLETQTILAEDNNIDLNYNGTLESALGGGITVLHGKGLDLPSKLTIDETGSWTTNTDFKSKSLTIPVFTPSSSNDSNGSNGNITRDNDYLYVKCDNKWKRTKLEEF